MTETYPLNEVLPPDPKFLASLDRLALHGAEDGDDPAVAAAAMNLLLWLCVTSREHLEALPDRYASGGLVEVCALALAPERGSVAPIALYALQHLTADPRARRVADRRVAVSKRCAALLAPLVLGRRGGGVGMRCHDPPHLSE